LHVELVTLRSQLAGVPPQVAVAVFHAQPGCAEQAEELAIELHGRGVFTQYEVVGLQ